MEKAVGIGWRPFHCMPCMMKNLTVQVCSDPRKTNIIMLNDLDKELERLGHHFVRYTDDLEKTLTVTSFRQENLTILPC